MTPIEIKAVAESIAEVMAERMDPTRLIPDLEAAIGRRLKAAEPAEPAAPKRIKLPVRVKPLIGYGISKIFDVSGALVADHMTNAEAEQIADRLNAEPAMRELVRWARAFIDTPYPTSAKTQREVATGKDILARLGDWGRDEQ